MRPSGTPETVSHVPFVNLGPRQAPGNCSVKPAEGLQPESSHTRSLSPPGLVTWVTGSSGLEKWGPRSQPGQAPNPERSSPLSARDCLALSLPGPLRSPRPGPPGEPLCWAHEVPAVPRSHEADFLPRVSGQLVPDCRGRRPSQAQLWRVPECPGLSVALGRRVGSRWPSCWGCGTREILRGEGSGHPWWPRPTGDHEQGHCLWSIRAPPVGLPVGASLGPASPCPRLTLFQVTSRCPLPLASAFKAVSLKQALGLGGLTPRMWWSEGRGREVSCVLLWGELISSVGYNPAETPPGQRHTARGHRPSQLGPSSIGLSSAWDSLTSGSLQGPGHVPWAALCLCSLEGVCSKAETMTEKCSLVPTKSTGPDLPGLLRPDASSCPPCPNASSFRPSDFSRGLSGPGRPRAPPPGRARAVGALPSVAGWGPSLARRCGLPRS